ncbi:MAG: transposase [Sphingorhabdus sp.]|nr:transposase [Sphingorhabdus sp.]
MESHYMSPGNLTQNAFVESFNGKLRDESQTRRCSRCWLTHMLSWPNDSTITTRSGRTLAEIAKQSGR